MYKNTLKVVGHWFAAPNEKDVNFHFHRKLIYNTGEMKPNKSFNFALRLGLGVLTLATKRVECSGTLKAFTNNHPFFTSAIKLKT